MTTIDVMTEQPVYLDTQYEVAKDMINWEIGYHIRAARSLGHDTEDGIRHIEAGKDLVQLQRTLIPHDKALLDAVVMLIRAGQIGRTDLLNEPTLVG